MRILSLETSTWWGGVALLERPSLAHPPVVVAEIGMQVSDTHAQSLLAATDGLLELVGWDRSSLQGYVATRGPGSFTGIRVALGTVVGLSLGNGVPATGETTLDAVAEAHGAASSARLVVIGAGRGEIYGQRFDAASSPPRPLERPWLASVEALASSAREDSPTLIVPAPGASRLLRFADLEANGFHVTREPRSLAAAAGRLALLRGFPATAESGERLVPLYLRPPDAELGSGTR